MTQTRKRKSFLKIELIYILLALVIVYITCILGADYLSMPSVLNDEIGYLANAAFFSGKDWSGIMEGIPYYSYGYSIFLSPFFLLFSEGQTVYFCAILTNIFFLQISYVGLWFFAKKLFVEIPALQRTAICLAIVINPYTVLMSKYALPECMLFMLLSLLGIVAYNVIKDATYKNVIELSLLTMLILFVHLRTFSVLMATVVLVLIMFGLKKISLKKVIVFFAIIGILFCLLQMGKSVLQEQLWMLDGNGVLDNDFHVFGAGKLIFSVDGIKVLIYSLAGKAYGMIVGYCFLPLLFGVQALKKIVAIVREKLKNVLDIDIFKIYLCVILVFTIGISTIYCVYPFRPDQVIYTRYNEYCIAPILLIVLMELYQKKVKIGVVENIIYLFIGIGSGYVSTLVINRLPEENYISLTSPFLSAFYMNDLNLYEICILLFVVFAIIQLVFTYKKNLPVLGSCCMILFGVWAGNCSRSFYDHQDLAREETTILTETIQALQEKEEQEYKIRLVRGGGLYLQNYYGGYVQALLPSADVVYIDGEDIAEANLFDENTMLVGYNGNMDMTKLSSEWQVLYHDERYVLLAK